MDWRQLISGLARLLVRTSKDRRQGPILLVSFFLAVVLWLLVTLGESYETRISVPLLIGKNDGVIATRSRLYDISVNLKGNGLDLLMEHLRLRRDTIHVEYEEGMTDLKSLSVSTYITSFEKNFSSQVAIDGFYPDLIALGFTPKESKKVPVRLATRIQVPPGYQLDTQPKVLLDSVKVYGNQADLETVEEWRTLPGLSPLIQTPRDILLPVDTARYLSTEPNMIPVSVNPVPYSEWRVTLPVKAIDPPIGTSVRLSHPTIVFDLVLPEKSMDSLINAGGFPVGQIEIPYTELLQKANTGWKPPEDLFAPYARFIISYPARIEFTIVRKKSELSQ